ncbi:putative quinol monooxygenase [Pseudomonas sp.]|uniref:putative quinol monooxygenase n=1 Tax=Pseudomonas sp. TaxID=306 RepID=UPI0028B08370|nr:putative quinol monooxygenase [Pseudomonas sp.]
MSDPISVIASIQTRSEHEQEVVEAIRACISLSEAEEGCLLYSCHKDINISGRFVFIERWASKDALDRHVQTVHFLKMIKAIEPLLVKGFDVSILTPI